MNRSIEAEEALGLDWSDAAARLLGDPWRTAFEAEPFDVVVDLGEGLRIHQEVAVVFGVPREAEGEVWVPVSWTAVGRAFFLPSFDGILEICRRDGYASLRLLGSYTVPLGMVGRFGDGLRGRRIARASVQALVAKLAVRLERAEPSSQVGLPGPTYTEVLRDWVRA